MFNNKTNMNKHCLSNCLVCNESIHTVLVGFFPLSLNSMKERERERERVWNCCCCCCCSGWKQWWCWIFVFFGRMFIVWKQVLKDAWSATENTFRDPSSLDRFPPTGLTWNREKNDKRKEKEEEGKENGEGKEKKI